MRSVEWRRATAFFVVVCLLVGCGSQLPGGPIVRPVQLPCGDGRCMRLLSWNVHALPLGATAPARLARIAGVIRVQQPEVVALQEVWMPGHRRLLDRELATDYRLFSETCAPLFGPCGGLVVLVRRASGWSADAASFSRYEAAGPWYRVCELDGLSGKGTQRLLLTREARSMWVINTHLQSQYLEYGHNYERVRRQQLGELVRASEERGSVPTIIAGDLNTSPSEALYETHVQPLGADVTAAERLLCECGTHIGGNGGREWIDYVFARNLDLDPNAVDVHRIVNSSVDDPFSDHDALLVRIRFAE